MTGPSILAGLLLLGVTAAPSNCSTMTITSYSAERYPGPVADGSTTTVSALARGEHLVAVDPRVIPLGSSVWVDGYGEAVAHDTGGGIVGERVDWLRRTQWQAKQDGVAVATVCWTPPGGEE